MESLFDEAECREAVELYGPRFGEDLALRVYTSRLLGAEPSLVLHGGGNTSVKSRVTELLGDVTEVLYVKGSGSDLASIEPKGFPACRLARLRRCCTRATMTDEEMVAELRGQMIDPSSPTPSVEALLHAFLPAKFVDHSHADAVLSVVDQPDSAELAAEVFGADALFIPYVMPGFALARRVAELYTKAVEGGVKPRLMVLDKHGIFTWGESARESYESMIDAVTRAEKKLSEKRERSSRRTISAPAAPDAYESLSPALRGALGRLSGRSWILSVRSSPQLANFAERDDLDEVSQIGCATPDHVLRTKPWPLVLRVETSDEKLLRSQIDTALQGYVERYRAYFRRSIEARRATKTELDPFPRVFLIPGFGAVTAGKSRVDAEIAADIYEHTASVIEGAQTLGSYTPASEIDLFDVEYWSLEQAKLAKTVAPEGPLARKIALVTGAGSGIGLAASEALLAAGAHVLLTDKDGGSLEEAWADLERAYRGRTWQVRCDVSSFADAKRAVAVAVGRFGGLDIVVSNAGGAWTGALHTPAGDQALRSSLEVNLLGHQNIARAAASVLLAQNTGGALLFNASKSAFNQGADFGPYAVPKAALISLMRQYAIDLAPHGVRSNAVNADRVRTDLFRGGMLEARAKARGVPIDEYFKGNLLKRETTANDVADAFVYLAAAEATTGCVITVDGGNSAAFPR